MEDCLQARRGADSRRRAEDELLTGPGELLLNHHPTLPDETWARDRREKLLDAIRRYVCPPK